jgi:hypothetical protein
MDLNDEFRLIFVIDAGVLGIGTETEYGCDALYSVEDVITSKALESDEYFDWGIIDYISPDIIKYFDL